MRLQRLRPGPARNGRGRTLQPAPLESVHRAAAARLGHGTDPRCVSDFGDPAAELAALEQGAGVLDETDLGALRIEGPDALDFLQRLLANDVRGLEPGRVQRNLLLSAKGKVLHTFELARLRAGLLLAYTAPGRSAPLAEDLEAYRFAEDLELAVADAEHAPLALLGPRAAPTLARVLPGVELPAEGRVAQIAWDGRTLLVLRRARYGAPGFLLDAGPAPAAALWRALCDAGAQPVGRLAREARRIAAGETLPAVDVDDTRYPQEARLEDAFSLSKGCYVGQEVVAKIDTYGGLHRRAVVLELDSELSVEPGSPLREPGSGSEIGRVTSAGPVPGGRALALGFVKLEHEAPGTRLSIGDGSRGATVVPPRPPGSRV